MQNPTSTSNPKAEDTISIPSYGAELYLLRLHIGVYAITAHMGYTVRAKVMHSETALATWENLISAAESEARGKHSDLLALFIDMLPSIA